jgi:hypothetical protein
MKTDGQIDMTKLIVQIFRKRLNTSKICPLSATTIIVQKYFLLLSYRDKYILIFIETVYKKILQQNTVP